MTHDHGWRATDIPGLCACECGMGRSYNRHTETYEYWDSTQYSCDHCGKYTENGAGTFLEELDTEDTICDECYKEMIK